jgi:hypothetical protein
MKKALFLLLAALTLTAAAQTTEYMYPDTKNPIFSITIPDAWKVEQDEEVTMIHALPADESIYLGFRVLDDAKTMDAALEEVDKIIADLVTNLNLGDAKEMTLNEIPFVYVDGTGKDKDDGGDLNISVALFIPEANTVGIVLYFGTAEAEKLHEKELTDILASIKLK